MDRRSWHAPVPRPRLPTLRVETVLVTVLQAEAPITGNHARRMIHGALKATSGHVEPLVTEDRTAASRQAFLRRVRQAWWGWHIKT